MKEFNDLKKRLEKARKCEDEQLPFVWEIMRSPYVEFHYSLLKDNSLDKEFRRDLMSRFDEHHEEGQKLLLSKLDNNEDVPFQGEIIFMLGKLNDNKNKPDKKRVIDYARKLTLSSDACVREKAIIVLGWIGKEEDITLLTDRLLNDDYAKCRAWAASSFMQMLLRNKNDKLIDDILPYLYQALSHEKDYFIQGCIIDAVQQLTKKRFGLSQASIDNIDVEKIEKAKCKALKYFNKLYAK